LVPGLSIVGFVTCWLCPWPCGEVADSVQNGTPPASPRLFQVVENPGGTLMVAKKL
jgi:hypothetical protein